MGRPIDRRASQDRGTSAAEGWRIDKLARHVVALIAAGLGYYAGLVVAVATLGLDGGAGAAPLFTLAGGGLVVGLALGLFDGRRRLVARGARGLGLGLVVGLGCWLVDPALEYNVGALVVLAQALAWQSWTSRHGADDVAGAHAAHA